MSAQVDAAKKGADRYAGMVLHYSHNAEKYLKTKDHHKAGEMMWGAMSCALKAVAAKKGKMIKSHRDVGKFAIVLSKQERDKKIFNSFSSASMLHQNFYESNLDPFLVESACTDIAKTIGTLMIKMGYKAP